MRSIREVIESAAMTQTRMLHQQYVASPLPAGGVPFGVFVHIPPAAREKLARVTKRKKQ